jgi:hypothetical protein
VPAKQSTQTVAPSIVPYVPAGQSLHTVAIEVLEK